MKWLSWKIMVLIVLLVLGIILSFVFMHVDSKMSAYRTTGLNDIMRSKNIKGVGAFNFLSYANHQIDLLQSGNGVVTTIKPEIQIEFWQSMIVHYIFWLVGVGLIIVSTIMLLFEATS